MKIHRIRRQHCRGYIEHNENKFLQYHDNTCMKDKDNRRMKNISEDEEGEKEKKNIETS